MENLNIESFNLKKVKLQALATACAEIDDTDLKVVKETRIKLKNARVDITKQGKAMRDEANKFSKSVITLEKELVAIIEPEETRLKQIEVDIKLKKEREDRIAVLPDRKEKLKAIGDAVEVTDEELLDMDGSAFQGYLNMRLADKNEADRVEIEQKKKEQEEAQAKLDQEKEAREREEKARIEEREKLEREQKEKEEREAREKEEAEKREKEAAEKKEREEAEAKEKLAKEEKYKEWLKSNHFDPATMKLTDTGAEVKMYKLVATYKK